MTTPGGGAAPPPRRQVFVGTALAGVAMLMIAIAAQSMFINDHDLRLLMWALVPAVLGAAIVAVLERGG